MLSIAGCGLALLGLKICSVLDVYVVLEGFMCIIYGIGLRCAAAPWTSMFDGPDRALNSINVNVDGDYMLRASI